MAGDDYRIMVDTVENGIRHITAAPSALVCSKLIDFDLERLCGINCAGRGTSCSDQFARILHQVAGKDR